MPVKRGGSTKAASSCSGASGSKRTSSSTGRGSPTASPPPYFLFDRSDGADVILSNCDVDTLRRSGRIDAHLEISSLNSDLLDAFAGQYGIDPAVFHRHAGDPLSLTQIKPGNAPAVLVAYEPYATAIEKNGFRRIASTRDLTGMMVIDALWMDDAKAQQRGLDLQKLKIALDRAVTALGENPEEYYETVKPYLEGQSYDEFKSSLEGIRWINVRPPSDVLGFMKRRGIPTERLIP